MKTIYKLLFFAVCMGMIWCCEKNEFFPDQPDPMLKKAMKVMPCSSADVMVKAETDWMNISEALQNAAPGEVVQLGEGTFYLHKSVVCWDFDGTLKGAGMGKTIIRTAPGMLFDVNACPPVNWSFEKHDVGHFFIAFPHHYFDGERTVSAKDFSIIVDEPIDVEETERNSLHGIMAYNIDLDNDRDHPINLNVSYKNLSLTGESDPKYNYHGYSLFSGVSGYGYSNGIFEAKNVFVENAAGCVKPHAFFGTDANVFVKNCHFKNCVFGVYAFYDHSWTILNNQLKNSVKGLVLIKKGPNREPWDGPDGASYIKENRIHFEGDDEMYSDAMGIGIQCASNVQIKNNVLEGTPFKYGGIVSLLADNWIIKDNDLCGVSSRPIYLLYSSNFDIRNNYNQAITPVACTDLIIGEGFVCED